MKQKILIIRFSSFGDIIHTMSVLRPLKKRFPDSEIHWVARSDMASIVALSPDVFKVWSFERKAGLSGLFSLGKNLDCEKFDYIYDAHNNIRSRLLGLVVRSSHFARRSKARIKRLLLFKFRINLFPKPFVAMRSYLHPLKKWGVSGRGALVTHLNLSGIDFEESLDIVLAPSAAHRMKTWPQDHFKKLIELLPERRFAVLGGPDDHFCQEFEYSFPDRVKNYAGKLSYEQSIKAVLNSQIVVSADTGIIQVADLLGVKGLDLIGPTAFGFPANKNIETLEVELKCRPCSKDGRGRCNQKIYQQCMVSISPELVASKIKSSF